MKTNLKSGIRNPGETQGLEADAPHGSPGLIANFQFSILAKHWALFLAALACYGVMPFSAWTQTLEEALDTPGRAWSTGGNSPGWSGQTNFNHDGVDAAQSGALGNSQTNWIETSFYGPAAVSFWWKVSSQTNGDTLAFALNSAVKTNISGEVNWRQEKFYVPYGPQVLRWSYAKNGSGTNGLDAAWLDQVQFDTTLATWPAPPEGNLVAWYPFNGNARDASGRNNHGTANGPTLTTDRDYISASAYLFDGSNDYIDCGNDVSLRNLTNFTLAAWFQVSSVSGNWRPICSKHTSDGAANGKAEFEVQVQNNGNLNAFLGDGTTGSSPETLLDGGILANYRWYHVALTVTTNQALLYLDGKLVASDGVTSSHRQYGTRPFQIGRFNNGTLQFFNGKIDEVRVYNTALSQDQILAMMDADVSAPRLVNPPPPLVIETNNGATLAFSTLAYGAAPLRYQWFKDALPLASATNTALTLTQVAPADSGAYSIVVTNSRGAVTGAVAQLTVTVPQWVNDAVDTTNWAWGLSGAANWFLQTTNTHDGADALQSGHITNYQESAVSTDVTGPCFLSYWWKVSSETDYDWLELTMDGDATSLAISGEVDWEQQRVFVTEGTHTLQWVYSKDVTDIDPVGADAAWLDQLELLPPPTLAESLDTTNLVWTSGSAASWFGQPLATHDGVDAAQCGTITNGQSNWFETTVTGPVIIAFWWSLDADDDDWLKFYVDDSANAAVSGEVDWEQRVIFVPAGTHTCRWEYSQDSSYNCTAWVDEVRLFPSTSLPQALDAPGLILTTGTNAPWFGQPVTTHDHANAAQSGGIDNNRESGLGLAVTGPGNLTFWWKVSSETNYDCFDFYIDGIRLIRASGEVDWHQESFAIPAGSNTVEWVYRKDVTDYGGADAAWLDEVVFTPTAGPAIVLWQQPASQRAMRSDIAWFDVVALGENLTYQWRHDGIALPGETNAGIRFPSVQPPDCGEYLVTVTNRFGTNNSSTATLTMLPLELEWQRSFGGGDWDLLQALLQTSDGGFLAAGYSYSTNGQHTGATFGDADYWVVRLNAAGDLLWQNSFGGANSDYLAAAAQTADGGFVLLGQSFSGPSGNKTNTYYGGGDFWLVRIDAAGNKIWDRSFGGSGEDDPYCIKVLADGSFLLAGGSASGISGNKSSANFGGFDFWLVKVAANGDKLWDISFGGALSDVARALEIVPGSGCLLAGYSASPPGGNKTNALRGSYDAWLVRVDANANKLWETAVGGTNEDAIAALQPTPDGGWLGAGWSYSGANGNKTSANFGGQDFWLVRLNTNGVKLWDQSYGGTDDDSALAISQTSDGGCLLAGASVSVANGSKSRPSFGSDDFWLVRVDTNGAPLWDYTFGGEADEGVESLVSTADGGFLCGGPSRSEPAGNKTCTNFGAYDFWLVKVAPDIGVTIDQQPLSQVAMHGQLALSVNARGMPPLKYQWQCHGTNLPGATNATLFWANLPGDASDVYTVVVSDRHTSLLSQPADLAVVPARLAWQQSAGGTNDEAMCRIVPLPDGGFLAGGNSYSGATGNKTSLSFGSPDYWVARYDTNGVKLWDRTCGGSSYELLYDMCPAIDGGCLLAGLSQSGATGNKTNAQLGFTDFWVVRLDAGGNQLWQRAFGGSAENNLKCARALSDGGFLLAGDSSSSTNGNKTSPNYGAKDFWVVCLDAGGIKLWDKSFGGGGHDSLRCVEVAPGGGWLLCGISQLSTNGNKTSSNFGGSDWWIVRLDANGSNLWDRAYGGSASEEPNAVRALPDGGFLLVGETASAADGNKTAPKRGVSDAWAVRVNATGNPVWQQSYGGSLGQRFNGIEPTTDGGFLLWGSSNSGADGNKTAPGYGGLDIWLVRIDAGGNKLWDRTLGGVSNEWASAVEPMADGGFLVAGYSMSPASGNKVSSNFGATDYWLTRVDAQGNRLWDYAAGGSGSDWPGPFAGAAVDYDYLRELPDHSFVLAGNSASPPSGNKTSLRYGGNDFWLLRFTLESAAPAPLRLIDSAKQGTNFCFWFQTQSNLSYTIEYNDDLGTTNWSALETLTGDGSLWPCCITVTNTAQRFVRVRQP